MNTSQTGIDLIKSFEKCRLQSYQDSGGVWTIGWGTTGPDVVEGLDWTQLTADQRFADSLIDFENCVGEVVLVYLNQDQFDALVCFVYNVGCEAFRESTLLRLLNEGNFEGAAQQFPKWDHVEGKESAGLLRRRLAEQALFRGVV
jgi:lysozyme